MATGLAVAAAPPARAALEEVLVLRTTDDSAVIERANGDRYRLAMRPQCPLLPSFVNRMVLLYSPQKFTGAEARVLIPEFDADCHVARLDSIGHATPRRAVQTPDRGLVAVREGLERLGYDCGPHDPPWGSDATQALLRYRESRRLENSAIGIRKAMTALAIDVLSGRQATGSGLRLSTAITDHATEVADYLSGASGGPGTTGCGEKTWMRARSDDGGRVTLGDGTIWQLPARQPDALAGWSNDDDVRVCAARLVNIRTGAMVPVARLR